MKLESHLGSSLDLSRRCCVGPLATLKTRKDGAILREVILEDTKGVVRAACCAILLGPPFAASYLPERPARPDPRLERPR